MPKAAAHALIWSEKEKTYTVYEQGQQQFSFGAEDDQAWLVWLANRSSFSFQGRHGRLNLLKEMRARGHEGYWYAYRHQGRRKIKQYAGRTPDLTITRLEELVNTPDGRANGARSIDRLLREIRQE